jgi:hypothetical protein
MSSEVRFFIPAEVVGVFCSVVVVVVLAHSLPLNFE